MASGLVFEALFALVWNMNIDDAIKHRLQVQALIDEDAKGNEDGCYRVFTKRNALEMVTCVLPLPQKDEYHQAFMTQYFGNGYTLLKAAQAIPDTEYDLYFFFEKTRVMDVIYYEKVRLHIALPYLPS